MRLEPERRSIGEPCSPRRCLVADGWQGSTVRAILENPRYTGYAFFRAVD